MSAVWGGRDWVGLERGHAPGAFCFGGRAVCALPPTPRLFPLALCSSNCAPHSHTHTHPRERRRGARGAAHELRRRRARPRRVALWRWGSAFGREMSVVYTLARPRMRKGGGAGQERGVTREKKQCSSLFCSGVRETARHTRHAAAPRSAVTRTHTTGTHARVPARVCTQRPPFLLFSRALGITPMPSSPTPDDPLSQLAASDNGGSITNTEPGRVGGRVLWRRKGEGAKGRETMAHPLHTHTHRPRHQQTTTLASPTPRWPAMVS